MMTLTTNWQALHTERRVWVTLVLSLLVHVAIFVLPQIQPREVKTPLSRSIEVVLVPPNTVKTVPAEPVAPVIEKPVEKPIVKPSKRQAASKVVPAKPDTEVRQSKHKPVIPPSDALAVPKPKLDTMLPSNNAPQDMMAYINAKRAQRQAEEALEANNTKPSEEQVRDETIKRNLRSGTNGIFEITSLDRRNATFSFRGWLNEYSTARRQFFEVEALAGEDVRLVMVRRMIGLIREHYQEDFNWESYRLGRVVVLSARAEDSAKLEDFLMMEFFGPNYKNAS